MLKVMPKPWGLSQLLQDRGMLNSAVLGCQIKSGAPIIAARIGSGPRFKRGWYLHGPKG